MRKAKWVLDYDFKDDKCYKCPGCKECMAPVRLSDDDGKYYCFSCGEEFELDDDMKKWIEDRRGSKIEIEDCYGCGGKNCHTVRFCKDPISLRWRAVSGECSECGVRWMV